ncbi:acyltransferase, partial [Streptomyces varsoviensis]
AVTALLVAAFRRVERPPAARGLSAPGPASGPLAALGVTLCLFGVLGLSMVGFGGLLEGRTALLVAVRVSAPVAVLAAVAGWFLVERAGGPARTPRR